MRLRAGLILFFSIILVAGGGRKPLAPTFDRNPAPQTSITPAPLDSLTVKNETGLAPPPVPGVLPSRFHLYWAGSDPDGKVVGFYYAVTETTAVPLPGFAAPPALPGPRASDYK